MPVRFHLDEHVSTAIANALRRRNINVTTTPEAKLLGVSDAVHLAFALRQARVIYTQDSDFLIAAQRGTEHAGIVYSAPNTRSLGKIIEFLVLLDACMTQEDMRNVVEFVAE